MKTAAENESELEKLRRESIEWLETKARACPPFVHLAVENYGKASQSHPTDEEIRHWAETVELETEDELTGLDYMILAAKAMRDGLIKKIEK